MVPSGKDKKKAYEEIAVEVSAVGPVPRTAHEIRKKKECWFSSVKKKVRAFSYHQKVCYKISYIMQQNAHGVHQ